MLPDQEQNISAIQKLLDRILLPTINNLLPIGGKISFDVSQIVTQDKLRSWDVPDNDDGDDENKFLSYYVFVLCEDPILFPPPNSIRLGFLIYKICGYVLSGRYRVSTIISDKTYTKKSKKPISHNSWDHHPNTTYDSVLKSFLNTLDNIIKQKNEQ